MENNNKIEMALIYYEKLGWSLIPVNKDKTPAISGWKKYQNERASVEQIKEWFGNSDFNIAAVTGDISKIAVVDLDLDKQTKQFSNAGIDLMEQLPGTGRSITGSGGKQYFYKVTKRVTSSNRILPGVDVKAEGGYVVLPPALHESGNFY